MSIQETSQKDSHLINAYLPELRDIITSIISTALLWAINALGRFVENFDKILPENEIMLFYGLIAVVVLIVLNIVINKNGIQYARIIKYVSIGGVIVVGLICCVHILLIMLEIVLSVENKLWTESASIKLELYMQREVLFLFLLGYMLIVYLYVYEKYMYLKEQEEKSNRDKELNTQLGTLSSMIIGEFTGFSESINELLKKKDFDTAITSTIISFKIEKEKGIVKAYLIANTSYPDYTWMFPGGHVMFAENQFPESVAKSKAKDEAGLDVRIIDLYDSYDLVSDDDNENQIDNMTVFNPPHYLYLFKLDDKAKCYKEKGHEYHVDMVYVGTIDRVNSLNNNQHRLYIQLPIELVNPEEVNQACYKAVRAYYKKYHVKDIEQRNIPEYIQKMLYVAYKDIVTYIKKH